jgi:RHS repeat-associated protein
VSSKSFSLQQLKSIENDSTSLSFKYNDEGIRTEKTVDGITTTYKLVDDRVTYETDSTNEIYYTYDSYENLLSMNLNGTEYYYVRNAQDDIIGLIDNTGTEVVNYTYDSWGNLISITGSLKNTVGVKNPYRYRGYRYDEETELYYLQSRYYNSEMGRFINFDDLEILEFTHGIIKSHNLYEYCGNSPVSFEDTNGFYKQKTKTFNRTAKLRNSYIKIKLKLRARYYYKKYVKYKIYGYFKGYLKRKDFNSNGSFAWAIAGAAGGLVGGLIGQKIGGSYGAIIGAAVGILLASIALRQYNKGSGNISFTRSKNFYYTDKWKGYYSRWKYL